jgi:hypothetical protein
MSLPLVLRILSYVGKAAGMKSPLRSPLILGTKKFREPRSELSAAPPEETTASLSNELHHAITLSDDLKSCFITTVCSHFCKQPPHNNSAEFL